MPKLALIAILLPVLCPDSPSRRRLTSRSPSYRPTAPRLPSSPAAISGPRRCAGGEAHLLVSHPANETRPDVFARRHPPGVRLQPDRQRRSLRAATSVPERSSGSPSTMRRSSWMAGRATASFSTFRRTAQDVAGMNDIFRISAEGGMPVAVTADRVCQRVLLRAFARRRNRWPSRRAAIRRASGGGTATATWTNPRSGWRPSARRRNTKSWPAAISNACGRCGAPTARASTT